MKRPGLCLDATGTLIEMTKSVGEVYAEAAQAFGVDLPAWRLDDAFRRVLRSAPPRGVDGRDREERRRREVEWWAERVRQTFQATDSTVRFQDFQGLSRALFETYAGGDRWRLRRGVASTLERLSEEGYAMGVVSNFDHRLPDVLQSLEIKDYFDFIEIPSERGERKPARALFEAAARSLCCGVDELVYVGDDSVETLRAIAAHGIRIFDISTLPSFEALPESLAATATLPSP